MMSSTNVKWIIVIKYCLLTHVYPLCLKIFYLKYVVTLLLCVRNLKLVGYQKRVVQALMCTLHRLGSAGEDLQSVSLNMRDRGSQKQVKRNFSRVQPSTNFKFSVTQRSKNGVQ